MVSICYMERSTSVVGINSYGMFCMISNENMNMHPISEKTYNYGPLRLLETHYMHILQIISLISTVCMLENIFHVTIVFC